MTAVLTETGLAEIEAVDITAWLGTHKVPDRVPPARPSGAAFPVTSASAAPITH